MRLIKRLLGRLAGEESGYTMIAVVGAIALVTTLVGRGAWRPPTATSA